jgi:hypothetical protein
MKKNILYLFFIFFLKNSFSQTILFPGDIAVIGFKTNSTTEAGNDAIKLVTLVDLQCNTKFIVTDNNWNNSIPGWACIDDEFGIEITCNTVIAAGSVFYLDVDASGNAINCSGGLITASDLGSPWGTNYGLSSQGDNIYVLQGSRTTPTFIFALKHSSFSNTSCTNKDQAGLPAGLTLGTNAVAMSSTKDQWHFNSTKNNGAKSSIISAICTSANWVSASGQSWNNSSGIFTITDAGIKNGVLAVSGSGCGCLANCNLAYSGSANCGTGVSGNCTAGYQSMSRNIVIPSGCTYVVTATMKNRGNGCSASGADSDCQTCDVVKVDILGGSKIFQQGASNSTLSDSYTSAGPTTIVVSGKANRADEIITYGINVSPCNCLLTILPIELVEFSANKIDESVEITWVTMSENDNDYFTVERSGDAALWETIYVMGGHGFSSTPYYYSIFDSSPLVGLSYYRLKQTDKNEKYTYSKIISIDNVIREKKIIKRINLFGVDVNENATGIIILIYDTGEVEKVYK